VYENGKMRYVETIPAITGGMGIKEDGESEFNQYILRTFAKVTMYPQYNNNIFLKTFMSPFLSKSFKEINDYQIG
jgi:hypothetical protein